MRGVELSQPNIVFPDTTRNEARLWRTVIRGERRLSTLQVVGIVMFFVALAYPFDCMIKEMISNPIVGVLFLGGSGAFFLLLRWRIRKALKH